MKIISLFPQNLGVQRRPCFVLGASQDAWTPFWLKACWDRHSHPRTVLHLFDYLLTICSCLIMFLDLNQYTIKSESPLPLTSPEIFQRKACFTFQYFVSSDSDRRDSRVLVFVRNASNSELLPFRVENVYYKRGRWHTINILLDHESGFDRVSHVFV